jgi:hypothetical protein
MCQVIIGGHKTPLFCHYRIEGALLLIYSPDCVAKIGIEFIIIIILKEKGNFLASGYFYGKIHIFIQTTTQLSMFLQIINCVNVPSQITKKCQYPPLRYTKRQK